VYEILSITNTELIYTQRWTLVHDTKLNGPVLQSASQYRGPITRDELFPNASDDVDVERIYTHKDTYNRKLNVTRRKIWKQVPYPTPFFMAPPRSSSVDRILEYLDGNFNPNPIKIYTDGSWKSVGSPNDQALLFTTSSQGGCSLVIMADSPTWARDTTLVFPITDDASSPTEHAYTWELMALSLASLIQFHYPGRCTVFSDCQSAIHTITKITTSSALQDQHAVLLYPVALLPTKPTIHHIPAHPERRIKTRPWTQDEHGIHIADIAASNPAELHHYNVASLLTDSFTSSQILTGFLDLGTWSWCYTTGIPILLPIKTIWQEHAFKQYLTKRDESHVNLDLSPSHAQWSSRSWRLAAKVHQFSSCNTMTRARLQRILFHWSGIGANL
jgi:hypothetical protein